MIQLFDGASHPEFRLPNFQLYQRLSLAGMVVYVVLAIFLFVFMQWMWFGEITIVLAIIIAFIFFYPLWWQRSSQMFQRISALLPQTGNVLQGSVRSSFNKPFSTSPVVRSIGLGARVSLPPYNPAILAASPDGLLILTVVHDNRAEWLSGIYQIQQMQIPWTALSEIEEQDDHLALHVSNLPDLTFVPRSGQQVDVFMKETVQPLLDHPPITSWSMGTPVTVDQSQHIVVKDKRHRMYHTVNGIIIMLFVVLAISIIALFVSTGAG